MALFRSKAEMLPPTTEGEAPVAAPVEATAPKPRPLVNTDAPTLTELMRMPNDGTFITFRVPKKTRDDINYDTIYLNKNVPFEPGKEYTEHPLVAKEVIRSIRLFSDAIMRQKTGRTIVSPNLIAEVQAQEFADRKAAEQFDALGMPWMGA